MSFFQHIPSLLASACLAGLLFVAAGCGGSGSSSPKADTSALKAEIAASVQQGFSARSSVATAGGTRAASRDEDGVQFDEFFGLWFKPVTDGVDYFLDEAATQPAGQQRTTTVIGEGGSFSQNQTLSITGGKMAGYVYNSKLNVAGGRVDIELSGTDPVSGDFETIGFFEGGSGQFTSTYTDEAGLLRTYSVQFNEDGTSRVSFNTGANYVYTLNFQSDGSGTGSVTGDNALLPAQLVWNTSGDGVMTFADGTTLEIKGFDFIQI